MDHIRHSAETSVRWIAGVGLLVIATVVAPLHTHPRLALDLTAVLLSLEAVVLWHLGCLAPSLRLGRAEAWLNLPGTERRRRALFAALLAETFRSYARRFAIPAALAWTADLIARISN